MERRHAERFPVALPVELDIGSGRTRDVSASGVFFETEQSFPVGGRISFALVLQHVDPGRPLRLRCEGQIVRVEPVRGQVGVGVEILAYRVEP